MVTKNKMIVIFFFTFLISLTSKELQSGRIVQNFNFDWTFHKGDVEGAYKPDFDDSAWRRLDLPHDWSIEGPFSKEWASGTGFLPGGIGWYRKRFTISQNEKGRKIFITFDGIYNHSEIWINGIYLDKRSNGYISFQYDLTPYIKFGEKNILSVKVDHSYFDDSRWYTGSGIYRDVQLIKTSPLHIKQWGVYTVTPQVTAKEAILDIETSLINESEEAREVIIENVLFFKGKKMGQAIKTGQIDGSTDRVVTQSIHIPNPYLWDVDFPYLYSLITTIKKRDIVLDNLTTRIGFRDIEFDANKGFSLSGKRLKLKGICMHHDAGCLGSAVPCKVIERRLDLLKEMGCNSIRTSHNPFSTTFLDLCDIKGFLVIDEVFDEWEEPKNKWIEGWNVGKPGKHGYADDFEEWAKEDLKDLVLRDRNHPSIIMWSIGNEVDYPNDPYTHEILNTEANPQTWATFREDLPHSDRLGIVARELVAVIKQIEPTRPVTAGLASLLVSNETGYADALDVVGYNYQEFKYEADHQKYPERILYGSENGMSYHAWKAVVDNDYVMGQYLWTGFEYMGESGRFPSRHSRSGVLDLAGNKKTEFYFRQSLWSDKPMVFIGTSRKKEDESINLWSHKKGEPHWNYKQGQTVRVTVFSNCRTIDLYLNNKLLGSQNMDDAPEKSLYWDIPFEPGTLKAVAPYEKISYELKTAGDPAKLIAESDVMHLKADKQDIAHVSVTIVDKQGIPIYSAHNEIICHIDGPVRLLGMEDSNQQNIEDYKDNKQSAYHGKVLLYLHSLDQTGPVEVTVSADGLESALVKLNVINRSL